MTDAYVLYDLTITCLLFCTHSEECFLCRGFEANWIEGVCEPNQQFTLAACMFFVNFREKFFFGSYGNGRFGQKGEYMPSSYIKCHQINTWRVLCSTAYQILTACKSKVSNGISLCYSPCDLLNQIRWRNVEMLSQTTSASKTSIHWMSAENETPQDMYRSTEELYGRFNGDSTECVCVKKKENFGTSILW